MAVVISKRVSTGAHVRICDDVCSRNTPEENERKRQRACEIAYDILRCNALDELERQKKHEAEKNSSPA